MVSVAYIHTWFRTFVLGGDDGIRLSRELRARSFAALTIINRHSLPLLLRIPSFMGQKVPLRKFRDFLSLGGDDGIRTHDPLLAGQVLSQLSYTPIAFAIGAVPQN